MTNLLNRTIAQFDTLVPYLGLAHKSAFELLESKKALWFDNAQKAAFPASFATYKKQIIQSALLLGYSYFEVFLADLMEIVFIRHPNLLPSNKQISFSDIVTCQDYQSLHRLMARREIHEIFYKGVEDIAKYFRERLNINWNERHLSRVVLGSLIRNCVMHNSGRADPRLARVSTYKIGDKIKLEVEDIHEFGLDARALISDLFSQATEKHLNRPHAATSSKRKRPVKKTTSKMQ